MSLQAATVVPRVAGARTQVVCAASSKKVEVAAAAALPAFITAPAAFAAQELTQARGTPCHLTIAPTLPLQQLS